MANKRQEEFDRVFKNEGGYFDLTRFFQTATVSEAEQFFYRDVIKTSADLVHKHLSRYKRAPKVHVAYLQNLKIGAVVTKDPKTGHYFIGINFGSVIVLRSLFARMLCSPQIFPWFGDISKEEAQKVNNPFTLDMLTLEEVLQSYSDQRVEPVDFLRSQNAKGLTMYAITFLALHELGHIVRGHIGYRGSRSDGKTNMLPQTPENAQLGLESQAMEFDADYFATFHGIGFAFGVNGGKTLPFDQRQRIIDQWLFAIYSTFRVLGMIPYNPSRLDFYSHPLPAMRLLQLINVSGGEISRASKLIYGRDIDKSEVQQMLARCVNSVELGFKESCDDDEVLKLGLQPILSGFLEDEHIKKVMAVLDNIWSNISRFKLEFVKP